MLHRPDRPSETTTLARALISSVAKRAANLFTERLLPAAKTIFVSLIHELPDSPTEDVLHASGFCGAVVVFIMNLGHMVSGGHLTPWGLLFLLAYAGLEALLLLLAYMRRNLRK